MKDKIKNNILTNKELIIKPIKKHNPLKILKILKKYNFKNSSRHSKTKFIIIITRKHKIYNSNKKTSWKKPLNHTAQFLWKKFIRQHNKNLFLM